MCLKILSHCYIFLITEGDKENVICKESMFLKSFKFKAETCRFYSVLQSEFL